MPSKPGPGGTPPVRRFAQGRSGIRAAPPARPSPSPPSSADAPASSFDRRVARAREAQEAAEIERLAALQESRHDTGAGPPKSDDAQWPDPADTPNTRSPKVVRGRARGAVLRRLHARGDDITRDHLEASIRFACAWDAARFGFTAPGGAADGGGGGFGPRLEPPKHAQQREAQARDVRRVLAFVGPAAEPLLIGVVIEDLDIAAWCDREATRRPDGRRPDPKKALGRLSAILDRLAEYYGIDERRDRAKAARASLARP